MTNSPKQNGPDPAIEEAIHRLSRTELSPLEETMFQAWSTANQVEDGDSPENSLDLRKVYQQTGGKVLPPNQLKRHVEKSTDIQTLMKAQEAHDSTSPIKAMMEAGLGPDGQQSSAGGYSGGGSDMGGGMMGGGGAPQDGY